MRVAIYCDPACPWCWVTSRWLVEVAGQRDVTIEWEPFSLWRKNRAILPPEQLEAVFLTHRWLRVFEAVREAAGNEAVGRLYELVGTARHHDGVSDVDMAAALQAIGLGRALAAAADDGRWDRVIARKMDAVLAMSGDEVGTPLITFDGGCALFGPIVSPMPVGEAAVRFFDAVHTLATQPGFWELKRSRKDGPEMGPRPQVPDLAAAHQPA
ncbi:MAG: mycothiol-dependent nitroreductase Rv2466c family protein [Candidatus Dormibacteria bacterium]